MWQFIGHTNPFPMPVIINWDPPKPKNCLRIYLRKTGHPVPVPATKLITWEDFVTPEESKKVDQAFTEFLERVKQGLEQINADSEKEKKRVIIAQMNESTERLKSRSVEKGWNKIYLARIKRK